MNFRQTAILLGAVIVVGVVLLILTSGDEKTTETDSLTEELASAKSDQIDTVEIEREGAGKLKMVRVGPADKRAWDIVEPYHAPADGNVVEAVVFALMKAKPVANSELTSNLAFHGLEPPGLKVTLRQGTDKSSTVNFGNLSPGGRTGVAFVTTSKRPNRPMAVNRGDVESLFKKSESGKAGDLAKWVADYRSHAIFPGDSRAFGQDVLSLKLELPNKKKELAISQSPSGWKFDSPAGWGDADAEGDVATALNTFNGVNPLIRTLTSMTVATAADFIDTTDLKAYGLNPDNPDRVRVEMKTKDKTTVVYIGKTEGGAPLPKQPPQIPGMPPQPPPTAGGTAYVMIEGQPGVIRATAGNLAGLVPVITDPNPLRDRNLLTTDPRKGIDGFDILLAGQQPVKLRRAGADWKLFGGTGEPPTASKAAVDQLEEVVTAKRVIKDFPVPKPEDFAVISATVLVWVDGFNPATAPNAEPTQKSPPVKFEFGRREGDAIYVRRTLSNGQATQFTVPTTIRVGAGTATADLLTAVSKTRLDLLERSLPSFSETNRIAVAGAANYTLAQDEKIDLGTREKMWRFVTPDPRAGKVADGASVRNDIIYYLANASSQFGRFVDENPTPEKLVEYGFAPTPRLLVTVDLPPSPVSPPNTPGTKLVFEFGKDTADPNFVYARIGGKPVVFTLGRTVFDKIVKVDLRDRVVFRFDPANVTAIDLRGWGTLGLGEQKMRMEKNKDGGWTTTVNGAPWMLQTDLLKVELFLRMLTQVRAKTFIAGNAPKPEYGFGDTNFLIITITFREGPPINTNIGAPTDSGASYFALSSTLPPSDPFFTLDADPLKPFKAGPTGFAKDK